MKSQLLSHNAYNNFKSFRSIADSEKYYNLLYKASDVLLHLTNHFYRDNDFENDEETHKNAYLKALACQVEYFYEMGEMTTAGLNSTPQVMDLGRTKVSMMEHISDTGATVPKSIICPDIYIYLEGTGLINNAN